MNPEEVIAEGFEMELEDGTIATVGPIRAREVEVEVVKQEEPADYWQANGFLPDIARICNDLEGEREQFMLPANVRQIIETINNAQTVQDFNRYNDSQLQDFRQQILRRLPEAERNVVGLVSQLTRARTVVVDSIDFI